MNFAVAILKQVKRNVVETWQAQLLTLLTVMLAVLIFSFFFLIYLNALNGGQRLGDDLRLVVYLDEAPGAPLQAEYRHKIEKFDQVEKIVFVSEEAAYTRFAARLGENADILADMPTDFLPASIEVFPVRSLDTLSRIKRFSDYLQTLPGVEKVQYGREWVERFYAFVQLLRVIVFLSGLLLILTTTFTVAHTIRLALLSRKKELELLRLVGASDHYIRFPFFLEGGLVGLLGSTSGIAALYLLFEWVKLRLDGSSMLSFFPFSFFPLPILAVIIVLSTLLCAAGSFSSTNKYLQ